MESAKKRDLPNFHKLVEEDDHPSQTNTKKICKFFPTGYEAECDIGTELFSAESESYSQLEAFLRGVVREEVESKVESLRTYSRNNQPNDDTGEETVAESRTSKFKLCFLNQIASIIFSNNDIEAENSEPLRVALCDVTNFNAIVSTGPLSSAQIEFFVVDGEFDSNWWQEGTRMNVYDFNKSVVSQRDGKRPLIVGNDLKLHLKDGVGSITSLSFTDNSSWLKTKKFRLGAKVIDEKIFAKFSRIGEAISQPFRVLDHRGEVNKKYHPPKGEDEVWRLEGISKNGIYHKNLSFEGIKTVDAFLKVYNEKGPLYLRKLLGKKVPNKIWKAMVNNALECASIANFSSSFEIKNSVGKEAMGTEDFEENLGVDEFLETTLVDLDEEWQSMLNSEDLPLFSHG